MNMNRLHYPAYTNLMKGFLFATFLLLSTAVTAQQYKISTLFPNLVSTDRIEYYGTATYFNNSFYFVRREGTWGDFNNKNPNVIYRMERKKGGWTTPEVAEFSGRYSDSAPFVSTDAAYLFFTSNRPYANKKGKGSDIWFMIRKNSFFGGPFLLKGLNSSGTEYSPVLTKSGKLYFASTGHGGLGQGDIFSCDFSRDGCTNIQNLGEAINSPTGEWNVFVDPDETYMIFEASDRIPGRENGDLYVSFRKNGQWQPAQFMDTLNSDGSDLAARLSADGKWLYFAQSHNGEVDIKKVSVRVLDQYR